MDKRRDRESNIELLRILAMLGVIILHYNNPSIGGGLSFVKHGSLNYWFLNVVESIFICAVNLFMIISAYFMASSNKRDLWKTIQLLAQLIIFSVSKYAATDDDEFFAEVFAMREMGEKIPDYFDEMLEEALKNGIM